MKTIRLNKTLTLNKKTIVNLDNENMNALKGGINTLGTICPSCDSCLSECVCPNTEPPLCTLTCDFKCLTETSRNCF